MEKSGDGKTIITARGSRVARYRDDHLEAIRRLLLETPGVREGKMFGVPAFFVGRRMFACLYRDGVGLKLPSRRAQALIEARIAAPFQPYGRPKMREWVQITAAQSHAFAAHRAIFAEAATTAVKARQD